LRRRPEFEALLEAVDAGKVGRVAAWSPERLIKAKRDEYRLYEACRKHDVIIAYIQAPDIDLSTPSGRLVADIMGASARLETELKSERQRAANRQSAERGGDPGGGRAFGYVRRFADAENRRGTVSIEVVPEEAELIREAARRILGGDSLSNLARDWAARGVTSVTGGRWDPSNIRRMLVTARISGRREYIPTSSHEDTRRPLMGKIVSDTSIYPAIISVQDSDALRRKFAQGLKTFHGRSYLLTGVLYCGRCEKAMAGGRTKGKRRYLCIKIAGRADTGCGSTTIQADPLEEYVVDGALGTIADSSVYWDALERTEPGDTDPELERQLRDDEKRLEELTEMLAVGELDRAGYLKAKDLLTRRIDEAQRTLTRSDQAGIVRRFRGDYAAIREQYDALSFGERQQFIAGVYEAIEVGPGTRGFKGGVDLARLTWWETPRFLRMRMLQAEAQGDIAPGASGFVGYDQAPPSLFFGGWARTGGRGVSDLIALLTQLAVTCDDTLSLLEV